MLLLFKICFKTILSRKYDKTLINPRYSAFDQTASTIGQLLVHSDISAKTKVTHMGVELVDERLFISYYSFILQRDKTLCP